MLFQLPRNRKQKQKNQILGFGKTTVIFRYGLVSPKNGNFWFSVFLRLIEKNRSFPDMEYTGQSGSKRGWRESGLFEQ